MVLEITVGYLMLHPALPAVVSEIPISWNNCMAKSSRIETLLFREDNKKKKKEICIFLYQSSQCATDDVLEETVGL